MEYKCKVCGGELQFNPELGKLRCPYCGSEYDMADYEETSSAIQKPIPLAEYA